jgi:hypothetical protein
VKLKLPVWAQFVGVVSITAGVYLIAGLGVALLVFGVVAVALGVLFESED